MLCISVNFQIGYEEEVRHKSQHKELSYENKEKGRGGNVLKPEKGILKFS